MSKNLKILITAKQTGSVNALALTARKLMRKGHKVIVYATGNSNEAVGFGDLCHYRGQPRESDYLKLVKGFDKVIVGLSGYNTPDGHFLRAANKAQIPTISVQDQDAGYLKRLGNNPNEFPTVLAVMNEECLETIANELKGGVGKELASRAVVVGWTAFDNYGKLKNNFSNKDKKELLEKLNLTSRKKINVHFTQNLHPDSKYMKIQLGTIDEKQNVFDYELKVTTALFEIASDMGLKLIVKPHPSETFTTNHTLDLVNKHGFTYLPADSCDSKELMLASDSITAGRSTCLTQACLLDKNTGGILPDLDNKEIRPFPPIAQDAIPYTTSWNGIKSVIKFITSTDTQINQMLATKRERFSVDGNATQKLVELIENL